MLRRTRVPPNSMAFVTTTNRIVSAKTVLIATSANNFVTIVPGVLPMDAIFVREMPLATIRIPTT